MVRKEFVDGWHAGGGDAGEHFDCAGRFVSSLVE